MPHVVRDALPSDVSQMHDMILELAQYEDGLDEVKASEEDLFRALFGGTSFSDTPANTPSGGPAIFAHVIDCPDGGLAAMSIWMLNYSTWEGQYGIYLEDLYVRPQFRGEGHGGRLLQALARLCVERDYGRLEWWVLDYKLQHHPQELPAYREQLGRYQLHDLVTQDPGLEGHADVFLWRGYDEILDRSVAVRILDADDPRCAAVLGAAQAAARVDDRRLLRVLDVISLPATAPASAPAPALTSWGPFCDRAGGNVRDGDSGVRRKSSTTTTVPTPIAPCSSMVLG